MVAPRKAPKKKSTLPKYGTAKPQTIKVHTGPDRYGRKPGDPNYGGDAPASSNPNALTGGIVNKGTSSKALPGAGGMTDLVSANAGVTLDAFGRKPGDPNYGADKSAGAAAQAQTLQGYAVPDLTAEVSAGFPQSIASIEQQFKDVYREIALREAAAQQSGEALGKGTQETLNAGEANLRGMGGDLASLGTSALGGLGNISLDAELLPALASLELMRTGEAAANRFLAPGLTTFYSGIRSQAQAAQMAALAEERARQQEILANAALEEARLRSTQGEGAANRASQEKIAGIYASRENGNLPGGLPDIPDDSFAPNEISAARGLYFSPQVKQNLINRPAYKLIKKMISDRMAAGMEGADAFHAVAAKMAKYGMTLSLIAWDMFPEEAYAEVENRFGQYTNQ